MDLKWLHLGLPCMSHISLSAELWKAPIKNGRTHPLEQDRTSLKYWLPPYGAALGFDLFDSLLWEFKPPLNTGASVILGGILRDGSQITKKPFFILYPFCSWDCISLNDLSPSSLILFFCQLKSIVEPLWWYNFFHFSYCTFKLHDFHLVLFLSFLSPYWFSLFDESLSVENSSTS